MQVKKSKTINKVKDVRAKLPLQKSSFSPATAPEKFLMVLVLIYRSLTSWEPQEEGMMSTTTSFSLSKKPRFNRPVGKRQTPEGDAC
jgi:hypothetical protein